MDQKPKTKPKQDLTAKHIKKHTHIYIQHSKPRTRDKTQNPKHIKPSNFSHLQDENKPTIYKHP